MLIRRSSAFALVALVGTIASALSCAGGPRYARRTMPSPDGCYVQVWEEQQFAGRSDFINGPRRYDHLRDLPGRISWKKRIRSITLGPNATLVAWTGERFEGDYLLMTSDARDRGRYPTVSVSLQSLEIRCNRPAGSLLETASDTTTVPGSPRSSN